MEIKTDDISKVMVGGEPAGRFSPKTIVYSEMAVRTMIYIALCCFKERHLTNQSDHQEPDTDLGRPSLMEYYEHPGGKLSEGGT